MDMSMKRKSNSFTAQFKIGAIFCGIALIIGLVSECSGQTLDEIVKRKAEKYLKDNMHDPSSYEFVSLKLLNKHTVQDDIRHLKSKYEPSTFDRTSLDFHLEYNHFDEVREYKTKIEESKYMYRSLDSLEQSIPTRNKVIFYTYIIRCRAKNAFGAKILSECYVQVGPKPKYELLTVTNNSNEILLGGDDQYPEIKTIQAQARRLSLLIIGLYMDSLGVK
jgi:hypothetical protein